MCKKSNQSVENSTDNWNAEDYAASSAAQQSWAEKLISTLELVGHEMILDIGCGDGKVTKLIAERVPHGSVIGIDRSRDMIALAKKQYEGASLSFKQMDALSIQFNHRFDLIFSNAALHWVKDHQQILVGIFQHLKTGGRILLQMGGAGNAEAVVTIVSKLISDEPWSPYFKNFTFPYFFYTDDQYRQWLSAIGFQIHTVDLFDIDMVHENVDGLKGWLRTTWFPYTDCLPQPMRSQFIDSIVSSYLDNCPADSEGKTHLKMVRLQVEAVKP